MLKLYAAALQIASAAMIAGDFSSGFFSVVIA
jgi:hypothetical protein